MEAVLVGVLDRRWGDLTAAVAGPAQALGSGLPWPAFNTLSAMAIMTLPIQLKLCALDLE